jgi:hypothetical protein
VTAELDTLLIALYVLVDDHVIVSCERRSGRPKKLSDAELICLAVAQVLLGARSEHHWLRMCYARLGHLFPCLPKQPGYHKRLRAAAPLLAAALDYLAREAPSWHEATFADLPAALPWVPAPDRTIALGRRCPTPLDRRLPGCDSFFTG